MTFHLAYVGVNYVFFSTDIEQGVGVEFMRITKDNWYKMQRPLELMITPLAQGDSNG